ncbi:MAG: hypothetical protein RLZZ303_1840 [Candidatus Hydrogenedentota bacterium]|jgi:hypothetical protein
MKQYVLVLAATITLIAAWPVWAQSAQVGADRAARSRDKLAVEYLLYRPARWEKDLVVEHENEFPNEGGFLALYLRNTSDKPMSLRFWRANDQDESYWRLNHLIAWDRMYDKNLEPGQLTVLEINAKTKDFAAGAPFEFNFVEGSWRPVVAYKGTLTENPYRVSYVRVWPELNRLTVHLRALNPAETFELETIEVEGAEAALGEVTRVPGALVATVNLAQPLPLGKLMVVKARVKSGEVSTPVYAHRRAHPDVFPIGVWSVNDETAESLHRMHIDTVVAGGSANDAFYDYGLKLGMRNMVHTGVPTHEERVAELRDKPSILCWMIQDEPDWSIPSNIMLHTDEELRRYDITKPTFITLCRNIKFMEYAPIADIPCQDHYAVTAPSSSKWPKPYGTRLEETAWYTRDLKYASEPKPIWIWTQGIADWGERPKRPVPTPNELAAQLVLNLGRGAKGILWFNHSKSLAEKWPDAIEAMTAWGRVMKALRADFLDADVWEAPLEAPEGVDVAALLGHGRTLLALTNTRYEIHPEAYPFETHAATPISMAWDGDAPGAVVRVSPDGVTPIPAELVDGRLRFDAGTLEAAGMVLLLRDAADVEAYASAVAAAKAME